MAAVTETESPSQLMPSEVHRTCTSSTPGVVGRGCPNICPLVVMLKTSCQSWAPSSRGGLIATRPSSIRPLSHSGKLMRPG